MATKPLPPPRGFMRHAQRGRNKVRYVYTFTDSKLGREAAAVHEYFLEREQMRFKLSKLHRLIQRETKKVLIEFRQDFQRCQSRSARSKFIKRARSVAVYRMSLEYPLFRNRNPLDQVLEHLVRGNRFFMKLDIADAFGSVQMGVHPKFPVVTKRFYEDLLTFEDKEWTGWPFFHREQGGLIQGAPASPHIFDTYCAETGFDRMLRQYAAARGFVVTRYVDDIVFSSRRPIGRQTFRTLRRMFKHYGFAVNESKLGRYDTHVKPIEFLGVSLYRGQVRPRLEFLYKMAALQAIGEGHEEWMSRVAELNLILKRTAWDECG